MYIDFNRVNTNNCNLYITNERLNELKELANKERTFVVNKYHYMNNITTILSSKAFEIAYVTLRNNALTDMEKNILASNIVFNDDKFVSILKKGNFNLAYLETYIKLVNYMKYKADNNKLSDIDQRYLNTVNIYTKKLVEHFNKYVGNVDKHVIINKLNEILTFNPELLEDKKDKIIR